MLLCVVVCCCVLCVVSCRGSPVTLHVQVWGGLVLHGRLSCQEGEKKRCAGALDGEEVFTIEGSENWRSTPDILEEREKCGKNVKNPIPPP